MIELIFKLLPEYNGNDKEILFAKGFNQYPKSIKEVVKKYKALWQNK